MKKLKYYQKTLLLLAFIEGGIVMCIELLGSRILAPTYGSSLEVWSIILAVSISALTLGYFFGGQLSTKKNNAFLLHNLFALSGTFLAFIPFLAKLIISDFDASQLILHCFSISILLLAPPLFLLGSTTPIIIELNTQSLEETGKVSGKIYAISTLGGIFFTYLTGFYLIPKHGLTKTAIIAAILISIISFFMLLQNKKKISFFLLPVFLLSFFLNKSITQTNNEIKVLHFSEGLLGQLLLVDIDQNNQKERALFINRIGQTWVNANNGQSRWDYPNYIASIASTLKPNPNVLVLGLGGGTVPRYLEAAVGAKVDAVEIDERMKPISRQYFNLNNTNIIIDDARHHLETTKRKYDLIIFDLYKGESPPSHTLSLETFEKTKSLLLENGLCIINFNGFLEDETGIAGRSIFKTLSEAGFQTKIIPTTGDENYRNTLFISGIKSPNLSNPKVPLKQNQKTINLDSLTVNNSELNLTNAILITDDLPILEKLNTKASKKWREAYYNNYTKPLKEKGVNLFK